MTPTGKRPTIANFVPKVGESSYSSYTTPMTMSRSQYAVFFTGILFCVLGFLLFAVFSYSLTVSCPQPELANCSVEKDTLPKNETLHQFQMIDVREVSIEDRLRGAGDRVMITFLDGSTITIPHSFSADSLSAEVLVESLENARNNSVAFEQTFRASLIDWISGILTFVGVLLVLQSIFQIFGSHKIHHPDTAVAEEKPHSQDITTMLHDTDRFLVVFRDHDHSPHTLEHDLSMEAWGLYEWLREHKDADHVSSKKGEDKDSRFVTWYQYTVAELPFAENLLDWLHELDDMDILEVRYPHKNKL